MIGSDTARLRRTLAAGRQQLERAALLAQRADRLMGEAEARLARRPLTAPAGRRRHGGPAAEIGSA